MALPPDPPAGDDDASPDATSTPARPLATGRADDAPTTPAANKSASPGATPRSRSNPKKPEPTLLADFLKGRPSAARLAADRKRRMSIEAVKAELRHEMRQSSVRRLQTSGGVRDRVKAWQKASASTAAKADPDDAATEPTEIAFKDDDAESVTEEDRIRIKMRLNKRSSKTTPVVHATNVVALTPPTDGTASPARHSAPPKKRVVSDDNWRKSEGRRTSPRKVSPKAAAKPPSPKPIVAPFVLPSRPSPSVSHKIKEWAAKVEVPDTPPPGSHRSGNSKGTSLLSGASDARDTASLATARFASRPAAAEDESIQVTPLAEKLGDDGIRVKAAWPSSTSSAPGARVRPTSQATRRQRSKTGISTRPRSKTATVSVREDPSSDRAEFMVESPDPLQTTPSQRQHVLDQIEVIEEPDSIIDTPTKRPGSKRRSAGKPRPQTTHRRTSGPIDAQSRPGDGVSNLGGPYEQGSETATNITDKSLADIPGDIPFGHSAFSELDLPRHKSRPKRAKVTRNSSLKSVPNVFKKVVEEGKKIIHDMNEPPKQPVTSRPPSIENWLNNTVDPFLDESKKLAGAPTRQQQDHQQEEKVEEEPAEVQLPQQPDSQRRSSYGARDFRQPEGVEDQENKPPRLQSAEKTAQNEPVKEVKSPNTGGLKRSRATRSPSSPLRASGRRLFLGALKQVFQGESSGPATQPKSYQSHEERKYDSPDDMSDGHQSSDYTSTAGPDEHPTPLPANNGQAQQTTPKMAGPRFRPPTKGKHELSTIVSEDDSSAVESDLTSNLTQSTLTQATALTRDSEPKNPHSHAPGLKRRLTRHSDLVSVLSLPDNTNVPSGIKDKRSRPSLRKNRGTSDHVTAEELLQEFVDDESLYQRELKTMVDGVVPVLLSHVVYGTNATELFGRKVSRSSTDGLSESVVNMGVALEKLRNAHKKAPCSDIRRLANWAHGVVPYYNNYLTAWRLGFEDVIVNLAPVAGRLNDDDDDDSLLNALPRNERGDVVDAQGERVAVAHLLKRPLIRVKQMTMFVKCVDAIINSNDTHNLLQDFENLQEKARRRHKEETARMTDEDANNTDTRRTRDLRTLAAADSVTIDPGRQVNAKDLFSLALEHSNGQRLECQVELVQRDSQGRAGDQGDLLIRETGDGRRPYLLFEPIEMPLVSVRAGDGRLDMVIMVRGMHSGEPWHELVTLVGDNEEQILDWLDILPPSPVPPKEPQPCRQPSTPPKRLRGDSVGAHSALPQSPRSPIAKDLSTASPDPKRPAPSRSRPQHTTTPPPAASPDERRGPETSSLRHDGGAESRSRALSESMRPDPRSLGRDSPEATSPGADQLPPSPPLHRSPSHSPRHADLSATSAQLSVEGKGSNCVKRRGSSPLKHEYLPSDVSSGSDTYSTDDSDDASSDDEIESVDIPETELGVSIKKETPPVVASLVSESECSLTPSNSASQAGLHGHKTAPEEYAERFMASISRWSEKGTWKDISAPPCSIIVKAGLIEAYPMHTSSSHKASNNDEKPMVALDLTPLVLIRQSTALDLEIRSSVQPHSLLYQSHSGGNFRFRCHNAPECYSLYMSVHHARLNNRKFIQLENETRFGSFGERNRPEDDEGSLSSRRRSWFGRKNSYRGSVRAPSRSLDGTSTTPSLTPSASSFLKRLTIAGNLSFNIARSSVGRQSMRSGSNSLYTSGSSSSGGTPPRSPSISVANSGSMAHGMRAGGSESIQIRLHLLVAAAKWEDYGNCSLQIRRPPPGWRQALRANHGLEKRVTATTVPRKEADEAKVVLDAVLGSGCFSPMGSRGIVCGVWEDGVVGMVPATGATGGNIKKWCFQFATAADASWVLRLVHQEVVRA